MVQISTADTGVWSGSVNNTWDTTSNNWSDVSGTPWDFANGPDNTAIFNTASLVAVVSGAVYTNSISFSMTGTVSGATINLVGSTPSISIASGQTGNISSIIAGSAGLVKSDAGTLTLSGANTYTGDTNISEGRLKLVDNRTGSSNFITNSELEFNITTGEQQLSGGTISGSGNLIKTGEGQLWLGAQGNSQAVALMGANSIIDVQEGTLRNEYGNSAWTDNLAGLHVANGATFDLWDGHATVDEVTGSGTLNLGWFDSKTLTIGVNNGSGIFSGAVNNATSGTLSITKEGSGTQTFTGNVGNKGLTTVNGGRLVLVDSTTGNGNFTINATLEFNITSGDFHLSQGTINGTGNLIKTGAGMLSLGFYNGEQTIAFTGATSLIDVQGGTVRNDWGSSAWGGNKAGLYIAAGATFDVWDATSTVVDELTGSGTIAKGNGSTTSLTIGTNNGTGIFSGAITSVSGSLSIIKQGTGTQTLTGSNTYSGSTTIIGGTLIIGTTGTINSTSAVTIGTDSTAASAEFSYNNSFATLSTSVSFAAGSTGGTLSGTGTISPAVTITAGNRQTSGTSVTSENLTATIGTETFGGGITYETASIFEWNLMGDNETAVGTRGINFDAVNTPSLGSTTGAIFRVILDGTQNFSESFWNTNRTWSEIFKTTDEGAALNIGSIFSAPIQCYNSRGGVTTAETEGYFTISGTSLNWTAVPEPGSSLVGILIGAGLLRRRRTL